MPKDWYLILLADDLTGDRWSGPYTSNQAALIVQQDMPSARVLSYDELLALRENVTGKDDTAAEPKE